MTNGNETKDYHITIDFAKHLCMLSRSERGKQARNYFIEIEKRYEKQNTSLEITDPLDLIIAQATVMKEIRKVQNEQGKEIKQLAAKIETRQTEYYTVAGYANLRGLKVDIKKAGILGKKATKISKDLSYNVGRTHDPRFGYVNTYHIEVLFEIFDSQ